MKRRNFLTCAAGAVTLLARGAELNNDHPGSAVVVRAGESLRDEVLQLGDRSFLRIKVAGTTPSAPLIIEQSELRRFGPPRHVHADQDEWFHPLSGTYQVEVGDEQFELRAGDFLFAPRGVPHVWKHVEDQGGRLIVGFEPAGKMLAFFRRFTWGGKLPEAPEMPALFAAHGMNVVGPPL